MAARNFKIFITVGCTIILTTAAGLALFPVPVETAAKWIPLRCPLLFLTGLRCPTCGLGRALLAAVSGDWNRSWTYHPLAIPLLFGAFLMLIGLWFFPERVASLRARGQRLLGPRRGFLTIALLVYSLWGLWRWYLAKLLRP